jgi:LytS/YehU family sensor histidine kinase
LQAELRQLKAQIHPHFLFNTLNSLYALAIRKDDRTAEMIVKLADFMRYMIRDAHRNKVPLEKETDYINNYIDLQRARLRNSVPIYYALEGDVAGQQIAPLLLFSFIENAFKHGVNPDEDSLIRIELRVQADELRLHVFNHKVRTSHIEASNGVGMPNAKDRLRLLYPDAHQLLIDDAPGHFRVTLTLTLT